MVHIEFEFLFSVWKVRVIWSRDSSLPVSVLPTIVQIHTRVGGGIARTYIWTWKPTVCTYVLTPTFGNFGQLQNSQVKQFSRLS